MKMVCVGGLAAGQSGRVVHHHLLELVERRAPGVVGELARGNLHHGNAQGPNIRPDAIAGRVSLGVYAFRLLRGNRSYR